MNCTIGEKFQAFVQLRSVNVELYVVHNELLVLSYRPALPLFVTATLLAIILVLIGGKIVFMSYVMLCVSMTSGLLV